MMDIYKCGTEVVSITGTLSGSISAVEIRYDTVVYEITYFISGEPKTAWLREQQLNFYGKEKTQIGYR